MSDWFSTMYWTPSGYQFSVPKTKLESLRERCAPEKTEKLKKPTPLTDQDALALFTEMKERIDAQDKRIAELEKKLTGVRRWAFDRFFGCFDPERYD